jgi:hypothetical protein
MTDAQKKITSKDELYERIIEALQEQIDEMRADRDAWKATAINNMHALRDVYRKPVEDQP